MVEQRNIFACRHFDGFVGIAGNPFVFFKPPVYDALVAVRGDNFLKPVLRAAVRKAKLPVCICLCDHRFYHIPQVTLGRIIEGHKDADFG